MAEAEVEYQDKVSPSIDVRFNVADEASFTEQFTATGEGLGEGTISVVIWTTTPWTLPANRAISLHPELEYSLVQVQSDTGSERLVVATDLLDECIKRFGIENSQVMGTALGQSLENMQVKHPFYDFTVPLILGEHVTTDSGTGCVHTAPGHGVEDFNVGRQYNLEVANPVGANGVYLENTPIFAGEHVFKANEHVVEVLSERGALVHHFKYSHSYPHCWRHKTPLIFRATPQWLSLIHI